MYEVIVQEDTLLVCDIVRVELRTVVGTIMQNTDTEDLRTCLVDAFPVVLCFRPNFPSPTLSHSVHSVFGFGSQVSGGG